MMPFHRGWLRSPRQDLREPDTIVGSRREPDHARGFVPRSANVQPCGAEALRLRDLTMIQETGK